jgi:hypothetical protein
MMWRWHFECSGTLRGGIFLANKNAIRQVFFGRKLTARFHPVNRNFWVKPEFWDYLKSYSILVYFTYQTLHFIYLFCPNTTWPKGHSTGLFFSNAIWQKNQLTKGLLIERSFIYLFRPSKTDNSFHNKLKSLKLIFKSFNWDYNFCHNS